MDSDKENLEKIVNDLEKIKINNDNLLELCLTSMRLVEKIPKLKGEEKKRLVIRSIEILLQRADIDNGILKLLPSFIDNIISVEKGKLKISGEKSVLGCLKICCK